MTAQILGTALTVYLVVSPHSDMTGPCENWSRVIATGFVILAIWWR